MKATVALEIIAVAVISILLFYWVVTASEYSGIVKFFICAALLAVTGMVFQRMSGIEGEYGLLLLRNEKGLELLDRAAEISPNLWRTLADFGMVMGFGVCSIFFFKKIPKKTFIVSLFILIMVSLFMAPELAPVTLIIIQLPTSILSYVFQQQSASAGGGSSALAVLIFLLPVVFGGLSIMMIIGLVANGAVVLVDIALKLLSISGSSAGSATALSNTVPGVAPVIPGINLPLFEGIIALAILLFVHEVSHGILARVENIKVKSSGLVLFGFLPFGAFVDPDEEQLQKSPADKQSRVLVAGSTANFITSMAAFLLLILFQYSLAYFNYGINESKVEIMGVGQDSYAYGILKEGMIIQEWNGVQVNSIASFVSAINGTEINETIPVVTDRGNFNLTVNDSTVGIYVKQPVRGDAIGFIYYVIALTFVLNFLIGSVNLLPFGPFDGYRIVSNGVRSRWVMRAIDIIVILSLILNILPWFLRGS